MNGNGADQELDEYVLTRGYRAGDWLNGALRAPGGKAAAMPGQADETESIRIRWRTRDTAARGDKGRWQRAQRAETAFWRTWRANELYGHIDLGDFWGEVVEKTGGPLPGGRVLDIGCGPVSVLNFCRDADCLPIGLDPLAEVYVRENLVETAPGLDPIPMVALPAERLPFADGALDHLICFNVLDHVRDAGAVLAEMARVLKPGGSARVYVHTFAAWIKRFLFFDRPHTYHWDHREFRGLLTARGWRVRYEIREAKAFDLPADLLSRLRHFPYWVATKVAFTSYFQIIK